MDLVAMVLVLGVAALATLVVAVGYVVWIRLVGLEPTLARRISELPSVLTIPAGLLLGSAIGIGIASLPTVRSGLAAVVMVSSSLFAGLLLFELIATRATAEL